MPIKIGLIGKTNTGKTTFFNSSTLSSDEISTYPFTTKKPSTSTGYAITLCVHPEFNVDDNPNNSKCKDGYKPLILYISSTLSLDKPSTSIFNKFCINRTLIKKNNIYLFLDSDIIWNFN